MGVWIAIGAGGILFKSHVMAILASNLLGFVALHLDVASMPTDGYIPIGAIQIPMVVSPVMMPTAAHQLLMASARLPLLVQPFPGQKEDVDHH